MRMRWADLAQLIGCPADMPWHRHDPGFVVWLQLKPEHLWGLLVALNAKNPDLLLP